MRLSDAEVGQTFTVLAVRISREVGRRLADMGFTEGELGRVVRGGAFRGPLQIRIRNYDVLLRRCEAAGIEIELVAAADEAPLGPDAAQIRGPGEPRFHWSGFGRGRRGGRAGRGAPRRAGDHLPHETGV